MVAIGLALASCSSDAANEANNPPVEPTPATEPTEVAMTTEDPAAASDGYTLEVHDQSTSEYGGILDDGERIETMLVDGRTIVFAAGTFTRRGGGNLASTHTPTADHVQSVLDTIDSATELAWANGHTRFLRGTDPAGDGSLAITVDFGCELPTLTDGLQAMAVLREEVLAVEGGGSCFGWALFSADGDLVRSGTAGES